MPQPLERQIASKREPHLSRKALRASGSVSAGKSCAVITRSQSWARAQTPVEAAAAALTIAGEFEILEDGVRVWDELIGLCRRHSFGGRQVHDANIVATMLAHGERQLLTFNAADFQRFAGLIELVVP